MSMPTVFYNGENIQDCRFLVKRFILYRNRYKLKDVLVFIFITVHNGLQKDTSNTAKNNDKVLKY